MTSQYRDDATIIPDSTPGPGQYLNLTSINGARGGVTRPALGRSTTSAFASAAKRGDYLKASTTERAPPPGAYDAPSSFPSKPKRRNGPGRPTSNFASTSSRLVSGLPQNGTGALGPGAYNPRPVPSKIDVVHTTSLFGNRGHDRWGKPYTQKSKGRVDIPGPGSYAREFTMTAPASVTSSAFKSTTKRGMQAQGAQPPGPAFYKTPLSDTGKKSFHLNLSRRWM